MVVGEKVRNLVGKGRGYRGWSLKFGGCGGVVNLVWVMKFENRLEWECGEIRLGDEVRKPVGVVAALGVMKFENRLQWECGEIRLGDEVRKPVGVVAVLGVMKFENRWELLRYWG